MSLMHPYHVTDRQGVRHATTLADCLNIQRTPSARQRILDRTFHRLASGGADVQVEKAFFYLDLARGQAILVQPPRERFRHLPPAERRELRERFERMTPAERKAFLEGMAASGGEAPAQRFLRNVPPEERDATRRMLRELSPAQRQSLRQRMQALAPEERQALRRQLIEASPEQRAALLQ